MGLQAENCRLVGMTKGNYNNGISALKTCGDKFVRTGAKVVSWGQNTKIGRCHQCYDPRTTVSRDEKIHKWYR